MRAFAYGIGALLASSGLTPLYAADSTIETVVVTAEKLVAARAGIQTQTGASVYTIDQAAIQAAPGGDNTMLNQVILQSPDVAQDSFGQLHVRGEHNGLQYRLNGIILPEGISVFGQTLDPRLVSQMKLITGALPAEYGLRTAGIIDLTTKEGTFEPGGTISMYGGSHGTLNPSFDYGGSSGNFNYFVSGDFLRNDLGIESPDGSSTPAHDTTQQYHGFGYFEDILDEENRLSLVLGTSNAVFQIPDSHGLQPSPLDGFTGLGTGGALRVGTTSLYPSQDVNESQREITHFGVVSWQHASGNFDLQTSLITRYSQLQFYPDVIGDLLFDGNAQRASKGDTAYGVQTDGSYHLGDAHTLRAGIYLQTDRATSATDSQVLPVNNAGLQTSTLPLSIPDSSAHRQNIYSAYLQDEWKLIPSVTLNYGVRFDAYSAADSESQVSPRANVVWQPLAGTTIHAGYARYFSPPPFELEATESVAKFNNTTAAAPGTVNDTSKAERANYFDAGAERRLTPEVTVGVDSYYKFSRDLIDEGQFGAPIILTPFNYKYGKQYGVDFTSAYKSGPFSAYANMALETAEGKDIVSSQFAFDPADVTYIANHYIHLDHEQKLTVSAGASYIFEGSTFSTDLLYGSGLRKDGATPNGDHVPGYVTVNLGLSHAFDLDDYGALTARLDVINLFDEQYEIRDGTGIGVGAPQWGARRGIFVGLSKTL